MLNNSHIYINMSETEKCCKICKSNDLQVVISMGNQKITSIFPLYGKDNEIPSTPVNLCMCNICGLIQLEEPYDSDSMYKNGNYGYRSGISNTMINHLQNYNDEINSKIKLDTNDYVLDIGSNDATFLKIVSFFVVKNIYSLLIKYKLLYLT